MRSAGKPILSGVDTRRLVLHIRETGTQKAWLHADGTELPCEELIVGEDIRRHLRGCNRAVLLGATLGTEVDRLLRVSQIRDMARAVVLDSLASVAIEQVCCQADELLAAKYPDAGTCTVIGKSRAPTNAACWCRPNR